MEELLLMSMNLIADLKIEIECEVDAILATTNIREVVDRTLDILQFTPTPESLPALTHHGRVRMKERSVSQDAIQQVLQYGTQTRGHSGRMIYEDVHTGVRVVTDQRSGRIITVISR